MIEINLLPGSAGKRKARGGGGAKLDLGAMFSGIGARIRDPYMISAVASVVVATLLVGGLYFLQQKRESQLAAAQVVAVRDSTRFANFLKQRRTAQATRDTVLRQINVIRTIDGDRYLWPHILAEVSTALPQYTWLTSLTYTGTPQGARTLAIIGGAAPAAAPARRRGAAATTEAVIDTTIVRDTVTIALGGQTVDLEAITRFMRQLESSPFISNVQLGKSQLSIIGRREVTTFSLQAIYVRVDSGSVIRRVPLAASLTSTAGN